MHLILLLLSSPFVFFLPLSVTVRSVFWFPEALIKALRRGTQRQKGESTEAPSMFTNRAEVGVCQLWPQRLWCCGSDSMRILLSNQETQVLMQTALHGHRLTASRNAVWMRQGPQEESKCPEQNLFSFLFFFFTEIRQTETHSSFFYTLAVFSSLLQLILPSHLSPHLLWLKLR